MKTRFKKNMRKSRYEELKRILESRRFEITDELQDKIRDVRSEGAVVARQGVCDEAESSEADIQDNIEFALLQMKTETLNRIEEALEHLEDGSYGYCYECGEEVTEQRLRALPFAVRCKDCEEVKEVARQRKRLMFGRRSGASLFSDLTS
jgi:DnaK suppressor protein